MPRSITFRRWYFLLTAGLFTLALSASLRPVEAGSALGLAQGGNIMQCMEQCIRAEGKAEKDTCKSRCANISSQPPKQNDCMGTFKNCQRACPKQDRNCHRACKDALMKCS
ncbi:MAG: hypothetical protein VW338_01905 [Rhodospirillaceae bacterium]